MRGKWRRMQEKPARSARAFPVVLLSVLGATGRVVTFVPFVPLAAFAAGAGLSACTDKQAPEFVADQFVDAYFRRMDQQGARQYTALGATEMLDREIELTKSIRGTGYTPDQAASDVRTRRGERSMRGERVRFDYAITIHEEGAESERVADVELAKLQSAWKVVRVDVHQK